MPPRPRCNFSLFNCPYSLQYYFHLQYAWRGSLIRRIYEQSSPPRPDLPCSMLWFPHEHRQMCTKGGGSESQHAAKADPLRQYAVPGLLPLLPALTHSQKCFCECPPLAGRAALCGGALRACACGAFGAQKNSPGGLTRLISKLY